MKRASINIGWSFFYDQSKPKINTYTAIDPNPYAINIMSISVGMGGFAITLNFTR